MIWWNYFALALFFIVGTVTGQPTDERKSKQIRSIPDNVDLQPAGSERLFDLGSLFNKYPNYNRPYYGYNTGYNPYSSGGYYPGVSTGYYPQTGSGYYPQTGGGYYPGVSGGGYGTNILGSGLGGYGGYGGNGGLPSYFGYNNNNYNGHRNLGYGYYRGTNDLGFLPSRDNGYVSGYRGYN